MLPAASSAFGAKTLSAGNTLQSKNFLPKFAKFLTQKTQHERHHYETTYPKHNKMHHLAPSISVRSVYCQGCSNATCKHHEQG